MRGSIRRRGPSWEYNCDIGMAAAQRCPAAGTLLGRAKAEGVLPELWR